MGYKNEVVFPVLVTPERAGEPVILNLQMQYGICKDICIPGTADISMKVSPGDASTRQDITLLNYYLTQIPKSQKQGETSKPSIRLIRADLKGEKPHLLIEAEFPKEAKKAGSIYRNKQ